MIVGMVLPEAGQQATKETIIRAAKQAELPQKSRTTIITM